MTPALSKFLHEIRLWENSEPAKTFSFNEDFSRLRRMVEVMAEALEKVTLDRGTTTAHTNASNFHIVREALAEVEKIAEKK